MNRAGSLIPGQARPQMRIERHGESVGGAAFECSGQRGSKAVRPIHGRNDQLGACMGKAFPSRDLPEAEGFPSYRIVNVNCAYMQQFVSTRGPERMRVACVEPRALHEIASPTEPPR